MGQISQPATPPSPTARTVTVRRPSPETQQALNRLLRKVFRGDCERWMLAIRMEERAEIERQASISPRLRIDWEDLDDALLGWALEKLGETEPEARPRPNLRVV